MAALPHSMDKSEGFTQNPAYADRSEECIGIVKETPSNPT